MHENVARSGAGCRGFVPALFLLLAACGGGGSAPAPAPIDVAAIPPPVVVCVPKVVTVTLYGDSTMVGCCGNNVDHNPRVLLQAAMDARFGAGAVLVVTKAVGGTSGAMLYAGIDGVNPPWNTVSHDGITVLNHGVNDEGSGVSLVDYKGLLRNFASNSTMVFQTPNPIRGRSDDYAQAMRDVAAETHSAVADVDGYLRAQPDLAALIPDGFHLSWPGYDEVTANVVAPAVAPLVTKLQCP